MGFKPRKNYRYIWAARDAYYRPRFIRFYKSKPLSYFMIGHNCPSGTVYKRSTILFQLYADDPLVRHLDVNPGECKRIKWFL